MNSFADLVAKAKAKAVSLNALDQSAAVAILDALLFAVVVKAANAALGSQEDVGRDGFIEALQGAASDVRGPPRR